MQGTPHGHPGRIHQWLHRFEVDRAVSFALVARAWQFVASPITSLLIATFFSEETQGFYYTFWSLIGLQTFTDLGFQLVVIHVASHEWSELTLNAQRVPEGSPGALARLAGLLRLVLAWYCAAAALFIPLVAVAGYVFFSRGSYPLPWVGPWLMLVVCAGASLCVSPLVAFLEGCNQVVTVHRYRLWQAITGNIAVWSLILLGAGLWVACAASLVQLAWELYLVGIVYRRFWSTLLAIPATGSGMAWTKDVWPLQWRVAVQSIFHYFGYQIFVPVMFVHSPKLAGQMGMTWTILTACQTVAFTWLQTRTPRLGMLIARRQYGELDRLFWRLSAISFGVLSGLACAFTLGVAALNGLPFHFPQRLAERLLDPVTVLVLSLGVVLVHVPRCWSVYLRAHKRDPLLVVFVVGNTALGLAVFGLGGQFGALAASLGFTATVAFILLPAAWLVWERCRREWHASSDLLPDPGQKDGRQYNGGEPMSTDKSERS